MGISPWLLTALGWEARGRFEPLRVRAAAAARPLGRAGACCAWQSPKGAGFLAAGE